RHHSSRLRYISRPPPRSPLFPYTTLFRSRVEWRDTSPSTNAELRALAREAQRSGDPLPHGTLLATDSQTAGRGRLDRGWVTPAGTALALSMLVRGYTVERTARQSAENCAEASRWGEL